MTQNIVALVVTINLRLNSLNLVTDYRRYTQIYDLPFYGLFSCKKNSPLGCVPSHNTNTNIIIYLCNVVHNIVYILLSSQINIVCDMMMI